ncbi:MAG: hypothetical protein IAE77_08660 [Prosthecobacter sp.]|jgi:hypothetical protein|uniref:hypothetical protein n=1 Tax=Prosthecobacter sp. TaxID=1965333 RepID=UPI0019F16299|nr:hypothetical protein [Prosthecobacter sp.]MBE2283521.1 hypothetical protein [Prosthecobacter sp.]
MDHQGVKLHETNEGRETQQGIAGFEGANALWFMLAFGLAIMMFQGLAKKPGASIPLALLLASIPIVLVSLYCFGLKQGKPPSYDVELFEWLIIKLSGTPYFSPSKVEPIALPWVDDPTKDPPL